MRGLAILLVLWHHVYMQPAGGVLGAVCQLNHAAWIGVDLFFVLSGFLITGILYDALGRDDFFRRFYKRRSLRIFPLYYGVLLALLALSAPLGLHWQSREWLLLSYTQNVGLHEPFVFDMSNWVSLNHFWSLAIEEQYYLVWPVIVWFVRDKIKLVWIALALSAAALGLRSWLCAHVNASFLLTSTPARADALLIGSALALVSRSYWRWLLRKYAGYALALSAAGCVAIGVYCRRFEWWDVPSETIGFTLVAVACASLIAIVMREDGWTARLFENRVLRFFGKYSYGLYVWHAFVYAGLRTRMSHRVGALVADAMCIALSLLVALASYHGFEKWFLRMKDVSAVKMKADVLQLAAAD
ncbi:MAG: acyltransferase [Acidobacteriaceae bacterium]